MKQVLKTLLDRVKPDFWDYYNLSASRQTELYNFRRIWQITIVLTLSVAIIPLIVVTWLDFRISKHSYEQEIFLRTSRLVANVWPTVTFFLAERKSALLYTVLEHTFEDLKGPRHLEQVLTNLKKAFGGFTDLGLISNAGHQLTYAGPYDLTGRNYRDEEWFHHVTTEADYISDVFLGFRNIPHIVIAKKHEMEDGSFYVLRTTIDMEKFNSLLSQLEFSGLGDAFIINHAGIIQTPSRYYGKVFDMLPLPIPDYSSTPRVIETQNNVSEPIIVGYAYIDQTPFILLLINKKEELMRAWHETKVFLFVFVASSILLMIIVILSITTYLVSRIFNEEQKKVQMLHSVEYSNKLASIGRLAAGVAHEINNPLAIINEKAGLIKDLFTLTELYKHDDKLMRIVDSIIASVERCSKITRRLLGFARHMDISIQVINLADLIPEVIGFMEKEAGYRNINLRITVDEQAAHIESDHGKLQQILLNIVNNALNALDDGGRLDITVSRKNESTITIVIQDTGCGIPESDLNRIFEPFFTTRAHKGGTGLGLSITYGLIKELGGNLNVQSTINIGTTFTITLPDKFHIKEGKKNAGNPG